MKKYLIILFCIISFTGYSQTTPSTIFRISNSATSFSVNIPSGYIICDVASGKTYRILRAVAKGSSLNSLVKNTDYAEFITGETITAQTGTGGTWLRLSLSDGTKDSVMLLAGTNMTSIVKTNDSTITFNADTGGDGTSYTIHAAQDSIPAGGDVAGYTRRGAWIKISGADGSKDSVLLKKGQNVSIEQVNDSTIAISATNQAGNDLFSQLVYGTVTWSGDTAYTFDVSECSYYIMGNHYLSEPDQVTLDSSDPTLNRIDVIYVDTWGNVGKITGVTATNPMEPLLTNPDSQLKLTAIYVGAATEFPGSSVVDVDPIYMENIEWEGSVIAQSGAVITFDNGTTPYAGDSCTNISISAGTVSAYFKYTRSEDRDLRYNEQLVFRIKTSTRWNWSNRIGFIWLNDPAPISNSVMIAGGSYGFDDTDLDWQKIVIPLTDFMVGGKTGDILMVYISGSGWPMSTIKLDNIEIQSGIDIVTTKNLDGYEFWNLDGAGNVYKHDTVSFIAGNGITIDRQRVSENKSEITISGDFVTSDFSIGPGTKNYVTKWDSDSTITNSLFQDDGYSLSVNTAPDSTYMLKIANTTHDFGIFSHTGKANTDGPEIAAIYGLNTSTGGTTRSAIFGEANGAGVQNKGIYGYAHGAIENIGIYGSGASTSITTAIGGFFTVSGPGTNFGLFSQGGPNYFKDAIWTDKHIRLHDLSITPSDNPDSTGYLYQLGDSLRFRNDQGIIFTLGTTSGPVGGATYTLSAETGTGGAYIKILGSDGSEDSVKLAAGTNMTITRTDANTVTLAADGGGGVNYDVQELSGTTPAWDADDGVNARDTLNDNTTITLSNLVAGTSGNLTIINAATIKTLTFSGYTNKISPVIYLAANQVVTSGGSKIDVFSWYYDGVYLMWNGTNDYQ